MPIRIFRWPKKSWPNFASRFLVCWSSFPSIKLTQFQHFPPHSDSRKSFECIGRYVETCKCHLFKMIRILLQTPSLKPNIERLNPRRYERRSEGNLGCHSSKSRWRLQRPLCRSGRPEGVLGEHHLCKERRESRSYQPLPSRLCWSTEPEEPSALDNDEGRALASVLLWSSSAAWVSLHKSKKRLSKEP